MQGDASASKRLGTGASASKRLGTCASASDMQHNAKGCSFSVPGCKVVLHVVMRDP